MEGNSQYEAIARHPELFANVKCMCSPLVPSMAAIFLAFSELQGVAQYQELIDLEGGRIPRRGHDTTALCVENHHA
jgi:hypothetical protein